MKESTVKELFQIKKGKKIEQVAFENFDTVRFIQIDDLRNDNNIKYCIRDKKYVYTTKDDVVIAWDGANAGTVGYNLEGAIGSTLAVLKSKSQDFNVAYVAKFLQSKSKFLRDNCTGATIPHISRQVLENITIPLPSMEIQDKMVKIFDKAQFLIDKRNDQRVALNILKQSIFLEMFGDPFINPNNWSEERLGNYVKVVGGYAFKSKEFTDNGIPVIKIGTVNKGFFDRKTLAFVPHITEQYKKYLISPGDLLITLTGTVGKEDYGNVCLVPDDYNQYLLNQRVAKLEPHNDLTGIYLRYCFKQPKFKRELTRLSRGVRQANISNEDIKNLKIPLPPKEIQEEFSYIENKIEKQIDMIEKSLILLENNIQSLLHNAFKGEFVKY
ncbi:restriction endonuclease subunit S [Bacillus zhangzhouensis]|uniref:restriction endonuclease subunit S n=1 Tax=Bacillus zhangzhouensis TaxID=1178540 RepID=UPI00068D08D0|nr:restriction endonuclease subunit S [Bacillus zhangzhouensis]